MLVGLPFDAPLRVLDLVEHYHATADALEVREIALHPEIQRYWGGIRLSIPPITRTTTTARTIRNAASRTKAILLVVVVVLRPRPFSGWLE